MLRGFVFLALVVTGIAIVLVSAPLGFGLGFSTPRALAFEWFGQVVGSGEVVHESRNLAPFHRITVNGSTDLRVTAGASQSIVVEAQKNIADIIETSVEDGTLVISSHKSYTSHHKTIVRVSMPELDALDVRGSADAVVEGARGHSLDLSIRGSGDVTASGSVDRLTYSCYGSGDARLRDLAVRDAVVRIRGSGDAQLDISSTLDVEVMGSGDVRYSGSPKIVRQIIHGSGSVSQR